MRDAAASFLSLHSGSIANPRANLRRLLCLGAMPVVQNHTGIIIAMSTPVTTVLVSHATTAIASAVVISASCCHVRTTGH